MLKFGKKIQKALIEENFIEFIRVGKGIEEIILMNFGY